jgi:NADPH2:quinone reductase
MLALQLTLHSPSSAPSLHLTHVPLPSPPTSSHIVVKIHASAIQPSDILNAQGAFQSTSFPRIPGRDFAGKIARGPHHLLNSHVYGTSGSRHSFTEDGFQAQYAVVHIDAIAVMPKNMGFKTAATIGVPWTTASLALRRAVVKEGERVLVLGADGAVGTAVVEIARSKQCVVFTATRHDSSDINMISDPELNALGRLTEGRGLDAVIDMTGSLPLITAAVNKLADRGRIALIPSDYGAEVAIDRKDLHNGENVIIECNPLKERAEQMGIEMRSLTKRFESGQLKMPDATQWEEVGLDDGVMAYEKASRGEGKYVLVME